MLIIKNLADVKKAMRVLPVDGHTQPYVRTLAIEIVEQAETEILKQLDKRARELAKTFLEKGDMELKLRLDELARIRVMITNESLSQATQELQKSLGSVI